VFVGEPHVAVTLPRPRGNVTRLNLLHGGLEMHDGGIHARPPKVERLAGRLQRSNASTRILLDLTQSRVQVDIRRREMGFHVSAEPRREVGGGGLRFQRSHSGLPFGVQRLKSLVDLREQSASLVFQRQRERGIGGRRGCH
jgi:hypothetical protein